LICSVFIFGIQPMLEARHGERSNPDAYLRALLDPIPSKRRPPAWNRPSTEIIITSLPILLFTGSLALVGKLWLIFFTSRHTGRSMIERGGTRQREREE